MLPLVSHGEYADGAVRQTDRRMNASFPLDAASLIIFVYLKVYAVLTLFIHTNFKF